MAVAPPRDPVAAFPADVCRKITSYLTASEALRWASVCYHFCAEAYDPRQWEARCRGRWGRLVAPTIDAAIAGSPHPSQAVGDHHAAEEDPATADTVTALRLKDLYLQGAPRPSWVASLRNGGARALLDVAGAAYAVTATVVHSGGAGGGSSGHVRLDLTAPPLRGAAFIGGAVVVRARIMCAKVVKGKKQEGQARRPRRRVVLVSSGRSRELRLVKGAATVHIQHERIFRHISSHADAEVYVEVRVGPISVAEAAGVDGAAGFEDVHMHGDVDDESWSSDSSSSSSASTGSGDADADVDTGTLDDAALCNGVDTVRHFPFADSAAAGSAFYKDPLVPSDWAEVRVVGSRQSAAWQPGARSATFRFPGKGKTLAQRQAAAPPNATRAPAGAQEVTCAVADAMRVRVSVYDPARMATETGPSLMGPPVCRVDLFRTDTIGLLACVAAERLKVPLEGRMLFVHHLRAPCVGPSFCGVRVIDLTTSPIDRTLSDLSPGGGGIAVCLLTADEAQQWPLGLHWKWYDAAAGELRYMGSIDLSGGGGDANSEEGPTIADVKRRVEAVVGAAPEGKVLQVAVVADDDSGELRRRGLGLPTVVSDTTPVARILMPAGGGGVVYCEWVAGNPRLAGLARADSAHGTAPPPTLASRWADMWRVEVALRPCPELVKMVRLLGDAAEADAADAILGGLDDHARALAPTDFQFAASLPVFRKTFNLAAGGRPTGAVLRVSDVSLAAHLAVPMLEVGCYTRPAGPRGPQRWLSTAAVALLVDPDARGPGWATVPTLDVYYTFDVVRTAVAKKARAAQVARMMERAAHLQQEQQSQGHAGVVRNPGQAPQTVPLKEVNRTAPPANETPFARSRRLELEREAYLEAIRERELQAARDARVAKLDERGRILEEVRRQMAEKAREQAGTSSSSSSSAAAALAPPGTATHPANETPLMRSRRLENEREVYLESLRARELQATRDAHIAKLSERGRVVEEYRAQMEDKAREQGVAFTASTSTSAATGATSAAAVVHNEAVHEQAQKEREAARDLRVERQRQAVLDEKKLREEERVRVEREYQQQMREKAQRREGGEPPPGPAAAAEARGRRAEEERDAFREQQIQREKQRALDEKHRRQAEKERVAREYREQMAAKAAAAKAAAPSSDTTAAASPAPTAVARPLDASSKALIQFCLPSGVRVAGEFPTTTTLASICKLFLAQHPQAKHLFDPPAAAARLRGITFATSFPRRTFTPEECEEKNLIDLGLRGRCQVMVLQDEGEEGAGAGGDGGDGDVDMGADRDRGDAVSDSSDDDGADDDDGAVHSATAHRGASGRGRTLGTAASPSIPAAVADAPPQASSSSSTPPATVTVELCLPDGRRAAGDFPDTARFLAAVESLMAGEDLAKGPVYCCPYPRRPYRAAEYDMSLQALGFARRQHVVVQWEDTDKDGDDAADTPPAAATGRSTRAGRVLGGTGAATAGVDATAAPLAAAAAGGDAISLELLVFKGSTLGGAASARAQGTFPAATTLRAACDQLLPKTIAQLVAAGPSARVVYSRPFPRRPFSEAEMAAALAGVFAGAAAGRAQQVLAAVEGVVEEAPARPAVPAPTPTAPCATSSADAEDAAATEIADAEEIASLSAIADSADAAAASGDGPTTTIQFAFPNGARVTHTFPAGAPLAVAKLWVLRHPAAADCAATAVQLMQALPRRTYDGDDMSSSFSALGLTPRTQLIVTKSRKRKVGDQTA